MEWLIGMLLGILALGVTHFIVREISSFDKEKSLIIEIVVMVLVWVTFGLMFEIGTNKLMRVVNGFEIGTNKLMRVVNGKVVETDLVGVLAWEAPEYRHGIQVFKGNVFYLKNNCCRQLNYKIYYRIVDEKLDEAQKYYDGVILKRKTVDAVLKETERLIQEKGLDNNKDYLKQIQMIASDYLKNFGIKVLAVE